MSHVSPASISQVVVGQIHRLDKDQPVTDVIPLEEASGEATAQQRMLMVIFSFFAALALFLAAIGIYSVLSYSVAQRTREIGVRVALGAERWSVLWLVVGHTVRLALFGIVIGSTVAAALTRLLVHFLFGVGPADIATFSAVALLLGSTAILASLLPALRATRVNPVEALRYE
jgi:putative ABC transport system permease protein